MSLFNSNQNQYCQWRAAWAFLLGLPAAISCPSTVGAAGLHRTAEIALDLSTWPLSPLIICSEFLHIRSPLVSPAVGFCTNIQVLE